MFFSSPNFAVERLCRLLEAAGRKAKFAMAAQMRRVFTAARDPYIPPRMQDVLYKTLVNDNHISPLSEDEIHNILKSAVEHEIAFVNDTMSLPILGFNSEMMGQYVKFVADGFAVMLDCNKIYNVTNPLEFMDMISLSTKTNFFESRVSEYSWVCDTERKFELCADF